EAARGAGRPMRIPEASFPIRAPGHEITATRVPRGTGNLVRQRLANLTDLVSIPELCRAIIADRQHLSIRTPDDRPDSRWEWTGGRCEDFATGHVPAAQAVVPPGRPHRPPIGAQRGGGDRLRTVEARLQGDDAAAPAGDLCADD